jgi:hypothetical protein
MGTAITRLDVEPLPIERFDELADRRLPALLRTRSQTRQLLRIHAKSPRHLELPSIESADLLRAPPCFLIARTLLRRHASITPNSVSDPVRAIYEEYVIARITWTLLIRRVTCRDTSGIERCTE